MAARKLHKIEAQTAIGSLTYYPLDELSELGLTEARRLIVETVVSAVKGYRLATSELLTTTYHELRDSLPDYLRSSGLVLVTCSDEGIIIRYDKPSEIDSVVGTWTSEQLGSLGHVPSSGVRVRHPVDVV